MSTPCYAGQAVASYGPHPLLDSAGGFVSERLLEDGPRLRPAYTVTGGKVPDERGLDLPGYPGARDRAGNWVKDQRQLDNARLICAAGLRAMGDVAPAAQAARWVSLADVIVADTARDCLHPDGRWQRAPHDARVDASLPRAGIRGAVPARDLRTRATQDVVRRELGRQLATSTGSGRTSDPSPTPRAPSCSAAS